MQARLEQIRANRSLNQLATIADMPRHTVVNVFNGGGTLSSLHRFVAAFDHVVTIDREGYDLEGLTVGEQLRLARIDSGATLKDTAAAAHINELTATRIESGTDCFVSVISRYAATVGVGLVLVSQDEIELRFARRDLHEWTDSAVLPLHALDGVSIPFDLINHALQARVEKLERRIKN